MGLLWLIQGRIYNFNYMEASKREMLSFSVERETWKDIIWDPDIGAVPMYMKTKNKTKKMERVLLEDPETN